jgi:PAS domain S-box-containing protein
VDVLQSPTDGDPALGHAPAGVQSLTRALSRALTTTDIAGAVCHHLRGVAGATAAAIVLRSANGDALESIGGRADGDAYLAAYADLRSDASSPAALVVRTGRPAWIESLARAADVFEYLPERALGYQALAALPLVLDDDVSGALLLAYPAERSFQLDEQMLLLAVAGECAVALQRAAEFNSERASRERLEVALNAANMGTWDWDLRTSRVSWSPELERIHGMPTGGFGTGLERYFEHLHPEDRERIRGEIGSSLESGELHIFYRGAWPNGEVHWYEAYGRLTRDADGRGLALRGVCMDVSARTQAERALRESEERFRTLAAERDRLLAAEHAAREQAEAAVRARDDFVTVVSHDLRNPLAAINWHLQMMRRRAARGEVPSPEQLVERLDLVQASITALSAQIDELHDATRLQAGHMLELRRRPTDVVALARESARALRYTTDTHEVRFECRLPELVGNWDPDRLERVLANLLSNAIKYSPSGGDVLVQVARDGDFAIVSVVDWGLGIPAADLPHVFERFRRASNVGGKIAGSGLGLAGALDIIELHGGTITVSSDEGRGSTFEVHLPLSSPD